jgi:multidrug/hemolysin transport system ATP-binding protein
MENIIEVKNISKSFKDIKAVDDLSFAVQVGQLYAFLGVNGAGKSTTISMMCGQLEKDGGEVIINGVNLDDNAAAVKKDIGVVFQNSVLDKSLSVLDNLRCRASLYGISGQAFDDRLKCLVDILQISDLLKRTVGKLSGGQRRRIDIARALVHNPKILILDEPTTGLDPQTRRLIWNVINNLRKTENMTVFLTTHYMEEAADADYVTIIDSGKTVAEGTPLQLKNAYTGDFIKLYSCSEENVKKLSLPYEKINGGFRISVKGTEEAAQLICRHTEIFKDFEIVKGNMDDVFLAVTGKKLDVV